MDGGAGSDDSSIRGDNTKGAITYYLDVFSVRRTLKEDACEDEGRLIAGRPQTVGAGLLIEREQLFPLVQEDFDLAQTSFPTVNG